MGSSLRFCDIINTPQFMDLAFHLYILSLFTGEQYVSSDCFKEVPNFCLELLELFSFAHLF
jgi:hypothetical protein